MNEEMKNEEQKESEKTGNFWTDKALPLLKGLWADKIGCLYLLALFLQVLFLLLQFLPTLNIVTKASFSLFGGIKLEMKKLSMFGCVKLLSEELGASIFMFLYIVSTIATFLTFFVRTVPYFIRKKDKIGKGFKAVQVCLIFYIIQFVLYVSLASGVANEIASELSGYYETTEKSLFSLTFAGQLYWIVALSLFIVQWVLSIKIKEKKEEDKINARVAEELKKEKEKENAQ